MSSRQEVRRLQQVRPHPETGAEATVPETAVEEPSGNLWIARLLAIWQWLQNQGRLKVLQGKHRRLRVSETVSLGEKRFVSIVEVDGTSFLIGGGTAGVSLLTQLENKAGPQPFGSVLGEAWQKKETA